MPLVAQALEIFEELDFSRYLETVWALISAIDKFIVERAPWRLAKDPGPLSQKLVDETLYTAAEALRIVCAWTYPVMPDSAARIWSQLGIPEPIESIRIADLHWGKLKPGQKVGTVSGVFPRLDAKAIDKMQELEVIEKARQAAIFAPASAQPAGAAVDSLKISIDDFAKDIFRLVRLCHRMCDVFPYDKRPLQ